MAEAEAEGRATGLKFWLAVDTLLPAGSGHEQGRVSRATGRWLHVGKVMARFGQGQPAAHRIGFNGHLLSEGLTLILYWKFEVRHRRYSKSRIDAKPVARARGPGMGRERVRVTG